jgi:hypothetical protein
MYFNFIYFNFASGAAPQQGVAAPDGVLDFFFELIHFNLFEMCNK